MKWQLFSRLSSYPIVFDFAEKSKLIVWRGLHGATGNLYCGLHEFEDMVFLLHFLRENDLFVDIGANIGSYTILGANETGAETIAFEPVPKTFDILKMNIALNGLENVRAFNVGLGGKKEISKFTKSLDTINHVALEFETDALEVQMDKFDNLIDINKTTLIKIDVEGFEAEVLKGMDGALKNSNLKGIIIEMNGSGKRYGFDEAMIHEKLIYEGFSPCFYSPLERRLTNNKNYSSGNVLYLRDICFIEERIASAKKYRIVGWEL